MRRGRQPVSAPGAVINIATLSGLRELEAVTGNEDILDNLITSFLAEAPRLFANMRRALGQAQRETLATAAEQLEAQAAAVGAERVAWLSREFYEEDGGGSEVHLVRLQVELQRARKCLAALAAGEQIDVALAA